MKNLVGICNRLLEWFAAATLFVLTALVFLNVVLRYGFNSGITATEELGRFLFVWLVFAGAILAAGTDSHVKVDFIVAKLPFASRRAVAVAGDLLMIFLCWLIVQGGVRQIFVNMDNLVPVTQLSLSWQYFSGAAAGAVIGVIVVVRMIGRLMGGDSFVAETTKGE